VDAVVPSARGVMGADPAIHLRNWQRWRWAHSIPSQPGGCGARAGRLL